MFLSETSFDCFDNKVYKATTSDTLLSWIRVRLANMLASDGQTWTDIYSRFNSGTYNAEWIVLYMNKFKAYQPIAKTKGLLYFLEQMPGATVAQDMTSTLSDNKYWASYNIPFFPKVYTGLAYDTQNDDHNGTVWASAPRALQFKALQNQVESMEQMKQIMRWNDPDDPLSFGCPGITIAARWDLAWTPKDACGEGSSRSTDGAMDCKISDYLSFVAGHGPVNYAQAGPTRDQHPPFCWNSTWASTPHHGHPDCFKFDWQTINTQQA